MEATEKIRLIKEIAKELDKEDYGIIDLTLSQFKLPVTDNFSGNKIDYIIQQIQNASSELLRDLASHLEINVDNDDTEINPTFWKEGFFRLFISHLASDKIRASLLKDALEKYAITSFVAHSDIEPTRQWQDEIELGLRTCDSLTAMMVDGFNNSNWTDQEIGFALGRDLLIIPIRIGKDPYGFIGKFQAITFKDIETTALTIFKSLMLNKKTSKKMAYSMIYKLENSNSFHEAKNNIDLISYVEYWDKKLIRKLKASQNNNGQIKNSFGVPERINYLVSELEEKYGT